MVYIHHLLISADEVIYSAMSFQAFTAMTIQTVVLSSDT
jgi:hypothetical protein